MDGTPDSVAIKAGTSADVAIPDRALDQNTGCDKIEHLCEYPGCGRVFTTKTGRGLHHRKAHTDWYDAIQKPTGPKTRWNQEEKALFARYEANLVLQGVKAQKINSELTKLFPDGTLEAIKGQRRKVEHKGAVLKIVSDEKGARGSEPATPIDICPIEKGARGSRLSTVTVETISSEDRTRGKDVNLSPDHNSSVHPTDDPSYEDAKAMVVEHIEKLASLKGTTYNIERLNTICSSLKDWDRTQIFENLSLYMRDTFPIKAEVTRKITRKSSKDSKSLSRKQARKTEYAVVQKAWKKSRSSCIRMLLKDKRTENAPPEDIMTPFWETIMTNLNTATPGIKPRESVKIELWDPISPSEIRTAYPPLGTAPGPDGLSSKDLRAIPIDILVRIYNIFLICGRLPIHLLESKTTLIPKKDGASEPGEFRPITVSSNFARSFHKILANRMAKSIKIDLRQKAFRPIDGCSENVFLMDFALRYCRKNFKPLYMASLDVAKAFDSVTHKTIIDTLHSVGVPKLMVEYVADTYERSITRLSHGTWLSHAIHPTCGVKQGDPLSPIIFNLIMDRLFKELPTEVGMKVGNSNLNAIGFADDLVLFATTKVGLQLLLDQSAQYLQSCGLSVNTSKCSTVSLRNVPKEKKSVVDATQVFTCQGHRIPALKRSEDWKYLGVPFTPEGRLMAKPLDNLKRAVNTITTAPLKPQQRLFILRTVVLPSLYHQLVLGQTNISLLNRIDTTVRMALRKWLHLPHDVPNAYFHADVMEGGLSFPSLRWIIPLQRFHRLKRLKGFEGEEMPEQIREFIDAEITRVEQRLQDQMQDIRSMKEYKQRFARLLHTTCDGHSLRHSRENKYQHRWITDGTLLTSGRDFIHMNKLRINAIPLRARMARGRVRDRQCRAGCSSGETLHHVLQICHRTHAPRIKRHDACLGYLHRHLKGRVSSMHKEPRFRLHDNLYKPDAVIIKDDTAIVLDAIVAGENANLDQVHQAKIDKYICLKEEVRKRYSAKEVIFTSLTISSRGLWSQGSCADLLKHKLISKSDISILSTRVLIGGLSALAVFNRSTAVAPRRKTS